MIMNNLKTFKFPIVNHNHNNFTNLLIYKIILKIINPNNYNKITIIMKNKIYNKIKFKIRFLF